MNLKDMESEISSKITLQRKSLYLISIFVILGIITGFIVSNYYFVDANEDIRQWNKNIDKWNENWKNFSSWNTSNNNTWYNQSWTNQTDQQNKTSWNNSFNRSEYDPYLTILTYEDVALPSIACIFLCIASYILVGLNIVYLKIYIETKSKYIQGLLFVLIPLLIFSCFMIRVVKSLYFSSALKYSFIDSIFGFGISGLGAMLILLSFFEIIGLSILFHKSIE